MNSKEALERLYNLVCKFSPFLPFNLYEPIKQDLDRLEQLEKENKLLKDINEINKKIEVKSFELINENTKLKKALGLIKDYLTIANDVPLMTFAERCFTEEEVKLLKSVLEEE